MSIYVCRVCDKEFHSQRALQGHTRVHNGKPVGHPQARCCCVVTRKEISVKNLDKLNERLKQLPRCRCCDKIIPATAKQFCNSSCAASYNNTRRDPRSQESKQKTSDSLNSRQLAKGGVEVLNGLGKPTITSNVRMMLHPRNAEGPCSIVYCKKCGHCNEHFYNSELRKFCSQCEAKYSAGARYSYRFKFKLADYPDLFDIVNIPADRKCFIEGKFNPDGLSLDHKVSVNEAIKHGYDAYYITHPLNCEIMVITDNIRKHRHSSMTYAELVELVNEYDSKKNPS